MAAIFYRKARQTVPSPNPNLDPNPNPRICVRVRNMHFLLDLQPGFSWSDMYLVTYREFDDWENVTFEVPTVSTVLTQIGMGKDVDVLWQDTIIASVLS